MPEPIVQTAESQVAGGRHSGNMAQFLNFRTHAGRFVWFLIVLSIGFGKELFTLIVHVTKSDLHSYILLVPFVSAYLLYTQRSQLPKSYGSSPLPALGLFILGLLGLASMLVIPALSRN